MLSKVREEEKSAIHDGKKTCQCYEVGHSFCATKADSYIAKEWYMSLARAASRRLRDLSREEALAVSRRSLIV